jgi:benzoyl-CoA reductase/2-hydroxyglutaryl-CoA dehydratase subunit BcrC/BadD/HgdB
MTATIGITSTVPIEILMAAGYQPVDLNNIFISDPHPERLVRLAERHGFPLNTCTWIKGIYGVCMEQKMEEVLGVTTGDCSNTLMLLEVLKSKGVNAIPFAYPDVSSPGEMKRTLKLLAKDFGTTLTAAEKVRQQLRHVRDLTHDMDRLTWQENFISGWENHYWLVSSSDFNTNIAEYQAGLQNFIEKCRIRQPYPGNMFRLAFCGVPSVFGQELYSFLEKNNGRVVYNEIQRQFAMPSPGKNLAEQYTNYTYPYTIQRRLKDIADECRKRQIDGIIHYVQAFCHRSIGDILFRQSLKYPILTLEGNLEFGLTQHLKTRLEAFLDMLWQAKNTRQLPAK